MWTEFKTKDLFMASSRFHVLFCSLTKFLFESYLNEILYFSDQTGQGSDLSKHSFLLVTEGVLQQSVSPQYDVVPYTTDIRADPEVGERVCCCPCILHTTQLYFD